MLLLLFLALPAVVQAQFTCTTNNGTITITKYTGSAGAVFIPGTINGLPVTSIGNRAFFDSSATNVTIPNSVISIGNHAFDECTSLTSVMIPNSVTNIGNYTFSFCTSLTNIAIPNRVTSIGSYAFGNCYSLTSVTIPGSLTALRVCLKIHER